MKRMLLVSLVVLLLGVCLPANAQPLAWYYAYLLADLKSSSLMFVNPLQPDAPPQTTLLNLYIHPQFPRVAVPSPDGRWILLLGVTKDNMGILFLLDLTSGEIHEVAPAVLDGTDNLFTGDAQDAVWSPDSQHIAFVFRNNIPDDEFSTDVFIYNLGERSLTRITPDNFRNHRVAWSPDSTRIATFTENCDFGVHGCRHRVEVFDIATYALMDMMDFSHIAVRSGLYDTACQLAWSPTGRYINFVIGCKATMFSSEVYVWDTISQHLEQVTGFTEQHESNHFPNYVFTTYRMVWIDAETLLVGAHVTRNVLPIYELMGTLSYNALERTTKILSRNAADFLTVNSHSGEVAFRAIYTVSRFLFSGYYPSNAYVNISVFDDGMLDTRISVMDGGNLSWQPDGDILAYNIYGGVSGVKSIVFVNSANGSITEHVVQPISTRTFIIPIGWVSVDVNAIAEGAS